MARRGKRRKLAKNIYADGSGISGFVTVRGTREEMRFLPSASVREIQRDMEVRRQQIERELGDTPLRGTVAHVLGQAIGKLSDSPADRERKQRLNTWIAACGDEPFMRLKRARINDVIATWTLAGKNANTIAKRISSFRQVWQDIQPDDAPAHAIERVKRPRPPKSGHVRGRALALVEEVLANVSRTNLARGEESKAYARLRALAWTGQPPALLQQVRPEHVRWTAAPPELYVQPRRKGEGVDAAWIPLLPQAVEAMREFFRLDAGGDWNDGVLKRAWDSAVKKTQKALVEAERHDDAARLEGMRVYDLRHSLLTAMGTATGDVHAVSEYARHSDIRTTLIYMRGSSSPRMKVGIQKLTEMLPRVPQTSSASEGQKPERKRISGENSPKTTKRVTRHD